MTTISAPVVGNGHSTSPHVSEKHLSRSGRPQSMSVSKISFIDKQASNDLDPDELFVKHTIPEIRFIQQQLRADADTKQEDLRVMVGERYRDLLQASTSIISLASSSLRVQQALEDTKTSILSQDYSPIPKQRSSSDVHRSELDTHLHALQLLSAHIKLLLDTPEHLWRLIEHRKYFQAAWLFLLAGVVHRALVREDDDGGTWSSEGVNVLEEFPLVKRQWEVISQFRAQIVHRATQSLREYGFTPEEICATLLTLHLIDSRPLMKTLSVFFIQRSKFLNFTLSWTLENDTSGRQDVEGRSSNGAETGTLSSEFRRQPVNKVRNATQASLNAISQTVNTARGVFLGEKDADPPLIRRVLEHIQSDSLHDSEEAASEGFGSLPPELRLTTRTLLTALPSSSHFLLLPSDLISYKPYVNIASSSSDVNSGDVAQQLTKWFQESCRDFQVAITRWFAELQSVKEVWSLRSSGIRWVSASGLKIHERLELTNSLDEVCCRRMIEIWRIKLDQGLNFFVEKVDSSLLLQSTPKIKRYEMPPMNFLFRASPLTTVSSHTKIGPVDSSFQKYKNTLRDQLVGRTALLDDVLLTLETCAKTIRQDFALVTTGDSEIPELVEQLRKTYRPDADALCAKVVEKLEKTVDTLAKQSYGLVFLGRVSDEMSTSSFIHEIGCQASVVTDFQKKMYGLYERAVDGWRTLIVTRIVDEHISAKRLTHPSSADTLQPSGPSSDLVQSLLTLSHSIQELGVCRSPSRQRTVVQAVLQQFITNLTNDEWDDRSVQSLYDSAFLWKLCLLHGEELSGSLGDLETRIHKNLPSSVTMGDILKNASDSLSRMQTLLAILLPQTLPPITKLASEEKLAALLPFGTPLIDQQFQSAVDVAKPKARFGLLLIA